MNVVYGSSIIYAAYSVGPEVIITKFSDLSQPHIACGTDLPSILPTLQSRVEVREAGCSNVLSTLSSDDISFSDT